MGWKADSTSVKADSTYYTADGGPGFLGCWGRFANSIVWGHAMKKNVASQVIGVQMISATDGSAFTGTVACLVTGDGGTQGAGGGSVTHEGNGFHSYAPTQAETNYDHIGFTFTGTGAIPATVQVFTGFPQTGDSFARIGADGAGLVDIPWNADWDAEVQSECADALTAYDPPTKAELDSAVSPLATSSALSTVAGYLDTEIAAILADTNELQADWANGGRLDLILDARASQTSVDTVDGIVGAILVDTAEIGAAGAGLTALASAANLATVDTVVDAILVDTDVTIPGLIAALNDLAASDILTTALTESYAADGAAPTLTQALYLIQQFLYERATSGTTVTVKKLDGSTTAATLTLDSSTAPTSITRAS